MLLQIPPVHGHQDGMPTSRFSWTARLGNERRNGHTFPSGVLWPAYISLLPVARQVRTRCELRLLQLGVFGFGLLADGKVGVSVFPEGEEVFISGEGPCAGSIGIRALRV